jgi:hypothetical protein
MPGRDSENVVALARIAAITGEDAEQRAAWSDSRRALEKTPPASVGSLLKNRGCPLGLEQRRSGRSHHCTGGLPL